LTPWTDNRAAGIGHRGFDGSRMSEEARVVLDMLRDTFYHQAPTLRARVGMAAWTRRSFDGKPR
jgi:hypothetical protein